LIAIYDHHSTTERETEASDKGRAVGVGVVVLKGNPRKRRVKSWCGVV
jgi:hypothetical protein